MSGFSGGGGSSGVGGGGNTQIIIEPLGSKLKAQSVAVTLATDEPNVPITGTVTANLGTLNGAATSANQTSGNASLTSLDSKTVAVNTGAVVVSSSALPSGAATSALQTAGNTSLSSIDGKISTAANQTTANSSLSSIDAKTPALVSGRQPVDGSGVTQPIKFADTANLDAFSRIRVSNPETLFDSKQIVDNQPLFWDDQQTTGAGTTSTYLTNQAASQLSVANVTAGTRVRQTFQRYNYQSGKSFACVFTGILGAGATGITRRVGYFDAQNGVFFQLSGTTLSVVVRTFVTGSAVDTVVTQANWNLDKLDGSGIVGGNPSGITIDTSKTQIMLIDFQWLGVGRVRFGFDIGGIVIYVHQVLNANVLSTVWMSNPNLPVRYEISNSGAGPAANLIQICSSIMVEGGRHNLGFVLSTDRGATSFAAAAGASIYPLIAIRLKSTYLMATIQQLLMSITCASNSTYRWCLLLNPTVVGTALSFTGVTNSALEVQTNTTNATTVTGGIQIISGYIDATTTQGVFAQEIPSDLRLGSTIAGVSDIIVVAVQTVIGGAENYFASLVWREQI